MYKWADLSMFVYRSLCISGPISLCLCTGPYVKVGRSLYVCVLVLCVKWPDLNLTLFLHPTPKTLNTFKRFEADPAENLSQYSLRVLKQPSPVPNTLEIYVKLLSVS